MDHAYAERSWAVFPQQVLPAALLAANSCLPHGIIVKSIRQQDAVTLSIVPNPARDNATLVLDKGLDGPGVLLVFSTVGQEVFRKAIPMEMARMEFSTAQLAPGLYHYQVLGPAGKVGEGKLAISR